VATTDAAVRLGPFDGRIDAELVRQYASATNDPDAGVQAGTTVPATMLATRIWEAQEATRATTPFDATTLSSLYPSRDDYLAQFDVALDDAVERGFVRAADRDEYAAEARAVVFP
jgi:hypothetical protein